MIALLFLPRLPSLAPGCSFSLCVQPWHLQGCRDECQQVSLPTWSLGSCFSLLPPPPIAWLKITLLRPSFEWHYSPLILHFLHQNQNQNRTKTRKTQHNGGWQWHLEVPTLKVQSQEEVKLILKERHTKCWRPFSGQAIELHLLGSIRGILSHFCHTDLCPAQSQHTQICWCKNLHVIKSSVLIKFWYN